MSTFGRNVLSTTGIGLMVAAEDLGEMDWKPGGVTLDWATVTAVGSDTTLGDGTVILNGRKGLRYGQILTQITASGKFGPYDSAAADGRQLLAKGAAYILNQTVLEHNPLGFDVAPSDHPAVLEGGLCWKARILMTTGAHSLAAGPTVAEAEAVFPRVRYAQS